MQRNRVAYRNGWIAACQEGLMFRIKLLRCRPYDWIEKLGAKWITSVADGGIEGDVLSLLTPVWDIKNNAMLTVALLSRNSLAYILLDISSVCKGIAV